MPAAPNLTLLVPGRQSYSLDLKFQEIIYAPVPFSLSRLICLCNCRLFNQFCDMQVPVLVFVFNELVKETVFDPRGIELHRTGHP